MRTARTHASAKGVSSGEAERSESSWQAERTIGFFTPLLAALGAALDFLAARGAPLEALARTCVCGVVGGSGWGVSGSTRKEGGLEPRRGTHREPSSRALPCWRQLAPASPPNRWRRPPGRPACWKACDHAACMRTARTHASAKGVSSGGTQRGLLAARFTVVGRSFSSAIQLTVHSPLNLSFQKGQ